MRAAPPGHWRPRLGGLALLAVLPGMATALTLPPGATMTAERIEAPGAARIPTGPYGPDGVPMERMEGMVTRRVWRVPGPDLTPLGLMAPLRAEVAAAGYTILLDCAAPDCGGFDFRYAAEILPEPAMHVDLGDYRSLSARRGAEALTITVSRDAVGGFVQIVTVAPEDGDHPALPRPAGDAAPGPIAGQPSDLFPPTGLLVLDGLTFPSGGHRLPEGDAPALAALADWLTAHPTARIALIGHTDASGARAANLALSQQRAEEVRRRLIGLGIAAERVRADGAGPLAPRASNLTAEGRQANRRVEAVLEAR